MVCVSYKCMHSAIYYPDNNTFFPAYGVIEWRVAGKPSDYRQVGDLPSHRHIWSAEPVPAHHFSQATAHRSSRKKEQNSLWLRQQTRTNGHFNTQALEIIFI